MSVIRWKLTTENRIGILLKITNAFYEKFIPVYAMEVYTGNVFVKFVLTEDEYTIQSLEILKKEFLRQPDIFEIVEVDLLPQEQREDELQAILMAVSDGIVSIDNKGIIQYANHHAANLLRIEPNKIVGKKIQEIVLGNKPIFDSLRTGKGYDNIEIIEDTPSGRMHYFTSGRPIKNEKGNIIGAVATLRSIKDARRLVNALTKSQVICFDDIIHQSEAIDHAIELAKKVARSKYPILIRGESGTGKELFARSIHEYSNRNEKTFVALNCAAIPETLLESELFGYEEGAFSGAHKGGKMGLFEAANEGTLFLDEIGEMSLVLQGKLLRVLQEGEIRRLGGRNQISVDVRVLTATNRNLEEMIREKQFREDLYYRINVIPLKIPPLRERPEDLVVLINYFLEKYGNEFGRKFSFSKEAEKYLLTRQWPGNVRELQNVVLRAIHLAKEDEITINDFVLDDSQDHPVADLASPLDDQTLKETVTNIERIAIEKALKKCGSARKSAKELGMSHTAVLRKINRYGLHYLIKNNTN